MTATTEQTNSNMQADRSNTPKPKRTGRAVTILAGVAVLASIAIWYFLIREVAPAAVDSGEAAAARSQAVADAGAADTSAGEGISGLWNVDTSIGEFADSCLTDVCSATFAGFRIDEVLSSIGAKTVVGRTPGVAGQVVIEEAAVIGAEFVIDMTGLITDSGARTGALRSQAIETSSFPEATFVLTSAIDLGQVPAQGDQVSVVAVGDLTVHGVTRTVEFPLAVSHQSGVIVVFGQLELALADFGVSAPSAAVVVSVEDTAIMELQLFLTR